MKKRALITGITGQTGSYLAEVLLEKGYQVHGLKRRSSSLNTSRIDHLYHDQHYPGADLTLHYGDLQDPVSLQRLMEKVEPHEVYNLAAQSHVGVSFEMPEYTADVNALGTLRLLEIISNSKNLQQTKFYQASSSELFGNSPPPQDELTPMAPRSPYAVSKLFAYWTTVNYREAYGIFACNGILFNHESNRRGETFVTKKIVTGLQNIRDGKQECLFLGNLDAKRDWGHARDYAEMQWRLMQQPNPMDMVIATGVCHTVRDFVNAAATLIFGSPLIWEGTDAGEVGINPVGDRIVVRIDPRYYRPLEVDELRGNPSRARRVLGYEPETDLLKLTQRIINDP